MSDFWATIASTHPVLPISNSPTALYPILDQEVLLVSGPDSAKFMQGQFTCNINEISPEAFRPGACCNPKGRMISSFTLAQSAENEYLLCLNKSLTQSTLSHLKKYMVFFKSTMIQQQRVLAGLKGPHAQAIIEALFSLCPSDDFSQISHELGLVIKLPFDAGYELWLAPDSAQATIENILSESECALASNSLWALNRIQHGLGQVTEHSIEKFIPQMLNLAQASAISFNKGCYTGQEIVARMQYLGKLKRHLYRGKVESLEPIALASAIYVQGQDAPVAEVVNAAHGENHSEILLVLDRKYSQMPLFLGQTNGLQIELLSLPYEIVPEEKPE